MDGTLVLKKGVLRQGELAAGARGAMKGRDRQRERALLFSLAHVCSEAVSHTVKLPWLLYTTFFRFEYDVLNTSASDEESMVDRHHQRPDRDTATANTGQSRSEHGPIIHPY